MVSVEVLSQNPCFRGLSKEVLRAILPAIEVRMFQRNQVLWRAGEQVTRPTFVSAGWVKLVRHQSSGRDSIIDLLDAGRWVDVAWSPDDVLDTSIVGLSQGVIASIDRQTFFSILREYPSIAMNLAGSLSRERSALLVRFDEVTAGSAETRLASLLSRLTRQEGEETDHGVKVMVPLSRQDLADLVGVTIETAIRIMSRWNRERVVMSQRDGFLIPDLSAMERLAA